MTHIIWLIVAALLLLPGIALSLIPGIPGILYMLGIAAVYGYFDGFVHLSGMDLGILAILAALTLLVDFISGIVGAKWGGAHWSSILWGMLGLVAGSILIPIPFAGSVVGMILGVLASELHRTHNLRAAEKAAAGSFFGWVAGTGFKIGASIVFLVLFVVLAAV